MVKFQLTITVLRKMLYSLADGLPLSCTFVLDDGTRRGMHLTVMTFEAARLLGIVGQKCVRIHVNYIRYGELLMNRQYVYTGQTIAFSSALFSLLAEGLQLQEFEWDDWEQNYHESIIPLRITGHYSPLSSSISYHSYVCHYMQGEMPPRGSFIIPDEDEQDDDITDQIESRSEPLGFEAIYQAVDQQPDQLDELECSSSSESEYSAPSTPDTLIAVDDEPDSQGTVCEANTEDEAAEPHQLYYRMVQNGLPSNRCIGFNSGLTQANNPQPTEQNQQERPEQPAYAPSASVENGGAPCIMAPTNPDPQGHDNVSELGVEADIMYARRSLPLPFVQESLSDANMSDGNDDCLTDICERSFSDVDEQVSSDVDDDL